jgi:trehalose 6-phosphate synthase
MQTARYMSLEERRNRHTELMSGLLKHDIADWRERFVAELQAASRLRHVA